MNLKNLSDEGLLTQTKNLVSEERRITKDVLLHLREVERRRLYRSTRVSKSFFLLRAGTQIQRVFRAKTHFEHAATAGDARD